MTVDARSASRRTPVIGITGPIGCGKSTVAAWLAELGAVVIDADDVAREVVEPGEPALAAVLARFGPRYRRPDGSLDRSALGELVFADPDALEALEAIIHPAVRPRIEAAIDAARRAAAPAAVVEAIKLVEGGLAASCDEVWLVTCDPAAQRERLRGRGAGAADADRRIRAQGSWGEARAVPATRVVDTTGDPADARSRVVAAWQAVVGH